MLDKLVALKDLAAEFFARRHHHETPKAFYRIISVGRSLEDDHRGEVCFFLSGSPQDSQAMCPLSQRKIEALLAKHLGAEAPALELFDRNHYVAHATTMRRAKQLASELVYAFAAEGVQPMADEPGRFAPKKPAAKATP
jgi:hypothetical protein